MTESIKNVKSSIIATNSSSIKNPTIYSKEERISCQKNYLAKNPFVSGLLTGILSSFIAAVLYQIAKHCFHF